MLSVNLLHLMTFVFYGMTALTLHLVLRKGPATMLGKLTLSALVPLVAGQVWLAMLSQRSWNTENMNIGFGEVSFISRGLTLFGLLELVEDPLTKML